MVAMSYFRGVSRKSELNAVIERHGVASCHSKVLRFLQSDPVQYVLMSLLLVDVVVTISSLLVRERYPTCGLVVRDAISCCQTGNGTLSSLCPVGLIATETVACNTDKYPTVRSLENSLWATSLSILSLFQLEMLSLLALLRMFFFRNVYYIFDVSHAPIRGTLSGRSSFDAICSIDVRIPLNSARDRQLVARARSRLRKPDA